MVRSTWPFWLPLQSCFAKDTAFFSAKAQKLKNSAKQNSWTVCRFSLWNSARCFRIQLRWIRSFGLGRLVSNGFLCSKAPLQPGFAKKTAFFSAKAQKRKNSAKQNSWIVCRFSPWNVFPPMKPAFFSPNSAPLNSGLWLVAFGKAGLFRCQSTPGPPMLCFLIWNRQSVSEFSVSWIRRLWLGAFGKVGAFYVPKHLCNLGLSKKLRFSLQRHKTAKSCAFCVIRRSRILGIVCRFPLLRLVAPILATALCKSARILQSRILG